MSLRRELHEQSPLSTRHGATSTSSLEFQWVPDDANVLQVTSVVHKEKLLEVKPGHCHSRFSKIAMNPLLRLKKDCSDLD